MSKNVKARILDGLRWLVLPLYVVLLIAAVAADISAFLLTHAAGLVARMGPRNLATRKRVRM